MSHRVHFVRDEAGTGVAVDTLDVDAPRPGDVVTDDGLEHRIRFVPGTRPDVDDTVVASGYRFRDGWLQYAAAQQGERVLCPPDVVESVEIDTAPIDD